MTGKRAPGEREIRSYVLRQGRTTPSQQRALDELFPRFGISFSDAFLDTKKIFGRTAPVVLEIGSGMGETTAQIAQAASGDRLHRRSKCTAPASAAC